MKDALRKMVHLMEMYEWNQGKRQINIEKHGIDFIDAIAIFDNPMLVMEPPREDERRFLALGEMDGRVIAVIYTILSERMPAG